MKVRTFTLDDCDFVLETEQRMVKDSEIMLTEVMGEREFDKIRNTSAYQVLERIVWRKYDPYSKEGSDFRQKTSGIPDCLKQHKGTNMIRFDIIRDCMLRSGYRIVIVKHRHIGSLLITTYGFEHESTIPYIERTCDL